MNNGTFIDIMDKINNVAKSKGYQNGIAWANKAVEAKTINQYDLAAFEGCHHLRNLMAHGFSRDIVISNETMNIAKTFYRCITMPAPQPQSVVQSKVLSATAEKPDPDAFAKKGDYVFFVANYSREYAYYADENQNKIWTFPFSSYSSDPANFINRHINEFKSGGSKLYVIRPKTPIDPKKYNKKNAYCVSSERQEFRTDSKGRQFISLRFKYADYYNSDYRKSVFENIDCEVYYARPECFSTENPWPLHVSDESFDKYLTRENLWEAPTRFEPKTYPKYFLHKYMDWFDANGLDANGDLPF